MSIRTVCMNCNNGVLSEVDRELCSRSPLSVIASQEINAHLWQAWDVDHSAGNLLLEGFPTWSNETISLYPQIIIDGKDVEIYGDDDEARMHGFDAFRSVLVKGLKRAFLNHENGKKKWIHFECIEENQMIERGYRLPPRFFCRSSIAELDEALRRNQRASFILRYRNTEDKNLALRTLAHWKCDNRRDVKERRRGSELPFFGFSYEMGKVLRGLAKIAVNAISHYCPRSTVNQEVIRVIRGLSPVSERLLAANGFVNAADVSAISADAKAHSMRIIHWNEEWHVWSSFFGGRLGTFVRFPGRNRENWSTADIVAPIGSSDWTVKKQKLTLPLKTHINWFKFDRLVPSVPLLHSESRLNVEPADSRQQGK